MSQTTDSALAEAFAAKRDEARRTLRGHMEARGLLEKDGWRIVETVRHRQGRTELVLKPMHLRLDAPPNLECVVAIEEPGWGITADCVTP
jgi:hypothetical protein